MRVPTAAEIDATAARLGLPAVTPRDRAKVAKVAQLAPQIDTEEQAAEQAAATFVDLIATTHAELSAAGLPTSAADRVVAAIAPAAWRDTH